ENVGLAEDEHILDPELDLGAAVLREDDLVALGDVHRNELALVVARAGADGQDLAALRLLPGGIRQHDAADGRLLLLEYLDDQAVTQWLQIHPISSCGSDFVTVDGTLVGRVPGDF